MTGTTVNERLLCEARPEVIETVERYAKVSERLGELASRGNRRTASETRLMKLLAVLLEDYDRRQALPPEESTPVEKQRYLLEGSSCSSAAPIPVFGQRSHANEALNGRRRIRAEQARKLGRLFSMKPGYFL